MTLFGLILSLVVGFLTSIKTRYFSIPKLDLEEVFSASLRDVGNDAKKYIIFKQTLLQEEAKNSWDNKARKSASATEREADIIIWKIREHERLTLFGNKASEAIPGSDTRDMGGQFITNKERIGQSKLFDITRKAPKGCHLHLHFNAELSPTILLKKARSIPNMFIRSTEPLLHGQSGTSRSSSYETTELVFGVKSEGTPTANIFSPDYNRALQLSESKPWMKLGEFITEYEVLHGQDTAEAFILSKMVLAEEAVYGASQTTNGSVRSSHYGFTC